MPKKKAAAKKRVSKTAASSRSRKRPVAKSSKKAGKKKATPSKKKLTRKKTGKKTTKKALGKKKKIKAKTKARKTRAGQSSKKRKEAKRKVASKKSASKSKASKKSSKKKASSRARSSKKKATASRAARPSTASQRKTSAKKSRAPGRSGASSRRGNVLTGPVPGFEPYQPKRNEEYMNDAQLEHFRGILLAWKRELMEEVDRTMHHMKDDASNPPDPNDRATQETEFGLELRTRDRERKLLKKIEAALDRIDDGSYGYCEETGDEIGLRRLEARPVATLCVEAQERRELAERQFRDREDYYR